MKKWPCDGAVSYQLSNSFTLKAKSSKHNTTWKATQNGTQDLPGNTQPMNAWQRQGVEEGNQLRQEPS